MKITIGLPNDVKWEDLAKEVRTAVDLNLAGGAKLIENAAKKRIAKGPKSGRVYKKRGNTIHQASAPGEAPATDTSDLIKSARSDAKNGVATVEFTAPHAVHLEYGTRRMKARPFLTPSAEENKARITGMVRSAVALGAERWARKSSTET